MSEQSEQAISGGDLGNTKQTKSLNKVTQSKYWCFTFHHYTSIDIVHFESIFNNNDIAYVMGFEICPTTGTHHIQGYIAAKIKLRPSSLKLNKKIHWEKIKGSQLENIIYCTKSGHYIAHGLIVPQRSNIICNLKPWQYKIEKLYYTQPDGRSVYWFTDTLGGAGKSSFCKYMSVKHRVPVIQSGKMTDLINIFFKMDTSNLKMVLFQ